MPHRDDGDFYRGRTPTEDAERDNAADPHRDHNSMSHVRRSVEVHGGRARRHFGDEEQVTVAIDSEHGSEKEEEEEALLIKDEEQVTVAIDSEHGSEKEE